MPSDSVIPIQVCSALRLKGISMMIYKKELVARGIKLFPVSPMDFNMGSIQAVHIQADGSIHGLVDPRRAGMAKGY